MVEGRPFQLNGKAYKVPAGWTLENWSGRDVKLDDGEIIHSVQQLHVIGDGIVCVNGDIETRIGTTRTNEFTINGDWVREDPYVDHCCAYLFVTMEMAFILMDTMDLESQEWTLFGVDHRGNVSCLSREFK